MEFIGKFFNWIVNSSLEAKMILAIGLLGVFVVWRQHNIYKEETKHIKEKKIPKWRRRYM